MVGPLYDQVLSSNDSRLLWIVVRVVNVCRSHLSLTYSGSGNITHLRGTDHIGISSVVPYHTDVGRLNHEVIPETVYVSICQSSLQMYAEYVSLVPGWPLRKSRNVCYSKHSNSLTEHDSCTKKNPCISCVIRREPRKGVTNGDWEYTGRFHLEYVVNVSGQLVIY